MAKIPKIHIPTGKVKNVVENVAETANKTRKIVYREGYNRKIYNELKEGLGKFSSNERGILNDFIDEIKSDFSDFQYDNKTFDYERLYNELIGNDKQLLNTKREELQSRLESSFESRVQDTLYGYSGGKYGGTEVEDIILQKAKYKVLSDGYTKGQIDYRKINQNLNNTKYVEQLGTNSKGVGFKERIEEATIGDKISNSPKPGDANFIGPYEAPSDYYKNPSNFIGKSREDIDFAYKEGGDEFVSNLATMAINNPFIPLEMDASDEVLQAVYDRVNKKGWQKRYVEKQYNAGAYKKHKFAGETFSDLTEEQQARLMDDLQEQLGEFNSVYNKEVPLLDANGNPVTHTEKRRFHRAKEVPEMTQEFNPQQARQNFIKHKLGYDPADSGKNGFDNFIDEKINSLPSGRQATELDAYRSYVKKTYNEGQTSKLETAEDFLSNRGLTRKEIKSMKVKDLGTANGIINSGDKSGIGLWNLIKEHPVATVATGITTAWALSEMSEID